MRKWRRANGGWIHAAAGALLTGLLVVSAVLAGAGAAVGQEPESEAQRLQRQIDELRAAVEQLRRSRDDEKPRAIDDEKPAATAADSRLDEIERQLVVLAEEIETLRLGEVAARADQSEHGLGVAASKVYRTDQGLSVGGYGEAVFESFDSRREDGAAADRSDQFDLLRGVLYFGYKFSDRWLFNSEIEFEHASTGEEGSASVEFAYLDYLWRPQLNVRAGLLLVPMGFVNELHEPTLFLSAERPNVERVIMPTTWRENGAGLFGDIGDWSYRAYLVNGLEGAGFSAAGLRGGRQKGSEALAEDFAFTGRLDYTGVPGLLAGVSAYVGDSGQDLVDPTGEAVDLGTEIFDLHVDYRWRGLRLRGLWARAELDDVARLNATLGLSGPRTVGDRLTGWYAEAGYDVLAPRGGRAALIPFARWETFDTHDSVPEGFARDPARDTDVLTLGLAFQPLDQLIFKLDLQDWSTAGDTGVDQWNLALGYVF